jgi:hypothetical protein
VLLAVRENDVRTQTLGYAVNRYKLLATFLSCALSGFAGGSWVTRSPWRDNLLPRWGAVQQKSVDKDIRMRAAGKGAHPARSSKRGKMTCKGSIEDKLRYNLARRRANNGNSD